MSKNCYITEYLEPDNNHYNSRGVKFNDKAVDSDLYVDFILKTSHFILCMDVVAFHSDQVNNKYKHEQKENHKNCVNDAILQADRFFTVQIELD